MRDPLDVLGVNADTSYAEAQRAYKRRVRLLHPDRVSDDPELSVEATKLMAELNDAWRAVKVTLKSAPSAGQATRGTGEGPSSRPDSARPRADGDHSDRRGSATAEPDTAQDILDWMIGGLVEAVTRSRRLDLIPPDDLLALSRPATMTLGSRQMRSLRVRVREAVVASIEEDLRAGSDAVTTPSGRIVPTDWWEGYVRLDELGNESLLVFVLDDLLDPPQQR